MEYKIYSDYVDVTFYVISTEGKNLIKIINFSLLIKKMFLSEIGEFGFINRLSEKFKNITIPPELGIGDDCAIIPKDDTHDYVVTTDMLVENIHFIHSKITPFELGYKTLAVNISDIAAMGAKPLYSFLSVAIPVSIEVEYLDQLLEGYKHISEKYNVLLMGGDTTRSEKNLTLSVTVIGIIEKNKARLRSMAQKDDIICVTGFLGDSGAGLKIILDNIPLSDEVEYLLKCHNCPEPAVNEGIWLANQAGVNAMMDISDGIASDLKHILKASQKSAVIELNNLPISPQLQSVANKYGFNVIEHASSSGEDYKLLLTVAKNRFSDISKEFKNKFGNDLFAIGNIIENNSENIFWQKNGMKIDEFKRGYNHFTN